MNAEDRSTWWAGLGVVALVAIGMRVVAWPALAGSVPTGEGRALEMLAWNVLDGVGFRDVVAYWRFDALHMPFAALFLAGIHALSGGSRFTAELVFRGVSVGSCLAVAGVGRVAFGSRAIGIAAGLLAAVYLPFLASAAVSVETLLTFLLALGTHLLLRATLERGRGLALASGVTFGFAALTSLSALAALPAILAAAVRAAVAARRKRRIVGPIVVPWALTVLLVFAIWPTWNALTLGRFFPASSSGLVALWSATTEAGRSREQAWRETLWKEPSATETERNRRLESEVHERATADPEALASAAALRAFVMLEQPVSPATRDGAAWLASGSAIAFWVASRLGAAGTVLALFRRVDAGILLGGTFCSLLAFQAFASDDPRQRMPGEWLWLIGAAYLLVKLPRFHREPLLSIDALDGDSDPPLYRTLLDRPVIVAPILGLVALPFLAVGVIAPLRRSVLAATPATSSRTAEPSAVSVTDLFALAKGQPYDAIAYPRTAVRWTGELSHFTARADGALEAFSFKPGKRGLEIGEAHVPCTVAATVAIPFPSDTLRRTGTVTATIGGTGAFGEPVLEVSEIRWE